MWPRYPKQLFGGTRCCSWVHTLFARYFLGSCSNCVSPSWYCSRVHIFWEVWAILPLPLDTGFQFILFGQFEQWRLTHLVLFSGTYFLGSQSNFAALLGTSWFSVHTFWVVWAILLHPLGTYWFKVHIFQAFWAIVVFSPGTVLGSSPGGLLSTQSRAGLCRNHRDRTQRLEVSLFISWVKFSHQPVQ